MASKFILIVKDGAIVAKQIKKPQAPRRVLIVWLSSCASQALTWGARHYAFRFGGQWHVLGVDHPTPLKSFPADAQAAAEMWLIHRENHRA